ncbi:prophage MuSo2, DNA circulation protein, putative, partial [Vibrio scophthalmi LMG 19158]
ELSNAVQASLDETAQTSLNNGMMQSWRALRGVRIALKRDVDERVLLLPEVREIKPYVTIPVALLAYQETGSTESRDGIIKRNKLRHPSFVMQGETVEIAVVKNG